MFLKKNMFARSGTKENHAWGLTASGRMCITYLHTHTHTHTHTHIYIYIYIYIVCVGFNPYVSKLENCEQSAGLHRLI